MRDIYNSIDHLKLFSEVGFRDIYGKFLYIDCRGLLDQIFPDELDNSITGIFAYCYIDRTQGISFRPFCLASLTEETFVLSDLPHQEDTMYVLRLRDEQTKMGEFHQDGAHMYLYPINPKQTEFFDMETIGIDTSSFSDIKECTDKAYSAGESVEELRTEQYAYLDLYRHEMFPDDVRVLVYNEEDGIEQVWVRLAFATDDDEIFGELLNEPYKDYGCHKGNLIEVTETTAGDEKVLVFTGRTAEKI